MNWEDQRGRFYLWLPFYVCNQSLGVEVVRRVPVDGVECGRTGVLRLQRQAGWTL